MALARVQAASNVGVAAATSFTITFSTLPTIGNGLIIQAVGTSAIIFPSGGCTDNQGNTYVLAVTQAHSGTGCIVGIYYCSKITNSSGTFIITINHGTSQNYSGVAVEFSGVGDGLQINRSNNSGIFQSGTTASGSGTATTIANTIQAAVVAMTTNQVSITASGGWTEEFEQLTGGKGEANTKISTIIGAQTITWTLSPTSNYCWALVSFNAILPAASVNVSQDVIEVLSLPIPAARVGQYVIEVLSATTPVPGRVSQYVVEVLSQNVEVTTAESTQFYIVMP